MVSNVIWAIGAIWLLIISSEDKKICLMEQLNGVDLQSLFQLMRFFVKSNFLKISYCPRLLIRSPKYKVRNGGTIGIRKVSSFRSRIGGT